MRPVLDQDFELGIIRLSFISCPCNDHASNLAGLRGIFFTLCRLPTRKSSRHRLLVFRQVHRKRYASVPLDPRPAFPAKPFFEPVRSCPATTMKAPIFPPRALKSHVSISFMETAFSSPAQTSNTPFFDNLAVISLRAIGIRAIVKSTLKCVAQALD